MSFRQGNTLATAFREKTSQKNAVLLLLTKEKADFGEVQVRRRGQDRDTAPATINKPKTVLEYNKHMGGVDQHDMMLYTYLDERRTVKYSDPPL